MKKTILGMFVLSITLFSACSSDDHDHDCEHCHIAFMTANGEIEVEIMNADGGEEFCGAELEAAEGPDFSYTLESDVIIRNDTVPAGNLHRDSLW